MLVLVNDKINLPAIENCKSLVIEGFFFLVKRNISKLPRIEKIFLFKISKQVSKSFVCHCSRIPRNLSEQDDNRQILHGCTEHFNQYDPSP